MEYLALYIRCCSNKFEKKNEEKLQQPHEFTYKDGKKNEDIELNVWQKSNEIKMFNPRLERNQSL